MCYTLERKTMPSYIVVLNKNARIKIILYQSGNSLQYTCGLTKISRATNFQYVADKK